MQSAIALSILTLALTSAGALAHHGWGSYDSSRTLTIGSAVQSLELQNPHVMLTVEHEGAVWHMTLAPLSRMRVRGLSQEMLKPGATVRAEGHPSTRNPNEMRAERITVGGETYEMR